MGRIANQAAKSGYMRRLQRGVIPLLRAVGEWRMLPEGFPKWRTVLSYFAKWREGGQDGVSVSERALKNQVGNVGVK
jgi:transposase